MPPRSARLWSGDDGRGRGPRLPAGGPYDGGQAVVELRLPHRFDQIRGKASLLQTGRVSADAARGHHDESGARQPGVCLDLPPEPLSIDLWHVHVQDSDLERVAGGGGREQGCERCCRPRYFLMAAAPGFKHAGQNPAVGLVVITHMTRSPDISADRRAHKRPSQDCL